jgi:hypothetical protein
MESKEPKELSDKEAYQLLAKDTCPFKLPRARSMTQAKIDLDSLKSALREWNSHIKQTSKKEEK